MNAQAIPMSAAAAIHPLIEQLITRHGFTRVDAGSLDAFASQAGHTLLVFTEDPVRFKETLDLAVIAPEVESKVRPSFSHRPLSTSPASSSRSRCQARRRGRVRARGHSARTPRGRSWPRTGRVRR